MRQLGKDDSLHGNTGRKRLMTLEKPEKFFQTFKPCLGSSNGVKGSDIKVDRKIISNQETAAEILADHFATIADDIGDVNVKNSSESDLTTIQVFYK